MRDSLSSFSSLFMDGYIPLKQKEGNSKSQINLTFGLHERFVWDWILNNIF
jgi:hypothetical protein